ncbi:unnamed protein product, partial [Brenthis ino]
MCGKQLVNNMDNNLDDSLNLESAMGVDFEHSEDAIVNQNDITLEYSGHEESIPMEFEHNEEQPILMDTGSEEIIDFMGDQFSLQEYSVQSDQTTGLTTTVESNQQQIISSQAESMIDIQFQPQLLNTIKQEPIPHKVIAVKTMSPMRTNKKNESALLTAPRQVAIAPKPPKLIAKPFPNKQPAIAPKPVTFIANRGGGGSLVKKVPISALPSNSKGNTVVAQIGKQLIMVPSSGSQKIKLVSASGSMPNVQYLRADPDQAQLIATQSVGGSQNKPVLTKLIAVQGQPQLSSQQSAVITKLVGGKGPRLVTMQQKTMPISLANKVLLATPSKQGLKLAKKQEIISIKSPTHKLMPAPALNASSSSAGKQKVVIPANSSQNVILKVPAPTKQGIKDGNMVVDGQRTQLHEINVPGKGVQYFRLITNSATSKPAPKSLVAVPSKTFMLADNKGNLIQMSAEKLVSGQPPPLVVAGNKPATLTKVASKPQQKLVRIAPIVPKTLQTVTQTPRSSQSLLAPLSPATDAAADAGADDAAPGDGSEEEVDSKAALRALIEKAVSDSVAEVEVEYEGQHSATSENSADGMDALDASARSDDHPLIVIPSNYDNSSTDAHNRTDDSQRSLLNIENDVLNPYQSPTTPAPSESDLVATELGLRPRKACNCTKSKCLKLYCDCFANGEFCNRCNCNNCHNNLENEELRQKAIRGCLERNPNAFRPKIGKAKIGGPDIIRRHNKGCNCKRSGCLKNYCECYEAKIACTSICKCVGCRNVEETLERARRRDARGPSGRVASCRPAPPTNAKSTTVQLHDVGGDRGGVPVPGGGGGGRRGRRARRARRVRALPAGHHQRRAPDHAALHTRWHIVIVASPVSLWSVRDIEPS